MTGNKLQGDHSPGNSWKFLEFFFCPGKSWKVLDFRLKFQDVLDLSWKFHEERREIFFHHFVATSLLYTNFKWKYNICSLVIFDSLSSHINLFLYLVTCSSCLRSNVYIDHNGPFSPLSWKVLDFLIILLFVLEMSLNLM